MQLLLHIHLNPLTTTTTAIAIIRAVHPITTIAAINYFDFLLIIFFFTIIIVWPPLNSF